MEANKKVAVIGAGLSGCTIARILAEKGYEVEVYEARDQIGGLASDYFDSEGYYQEFGPHILHTDKSEVVEFLSRFGDFSRRMDHRVAIRAKCGLVVPYPISSETYHTLGIEGIPVDEFTLPRDGTFRTAAIKKFGLKMYEEVIEFNTTKGWSPLSTSDLNESIVDRIRLSEDRELFGDKRYVGVPSKGWSHLMACMLDHSSIRVHYGSTVGREDIRSLVNEGSEVVCTAPILFKSDDFIHRKFMKVSSSHGLGLPIVSQEGIIVMNDSSEGTDVIRVSDYRKFPVDQPLCRGNIGIELTASESDEGSVMCYPKPGLSARCEYSLPTDILERVHFLGRLGRGKYLDMDIAVEEALELGDLI